LGQFELAWKRLHGNRGGSNSYEDGVSYTPHEFVLNPHALITMEDGFPHQPPLAFNFVKI
jgi:hypothetical protein